MKKPSEETMRKFVAFCDSGRPWYFTLGMSVTVLIVQFALWFAADEDKKPGWWYTVPAWFGFFRRLADDPFGHVHGVVTKAFQIFGHHKQIHSINTISYLTKIN